MGFGKFVHNSSNKNEKLGPKGNKCIFIMHHDHFKGYVLISKQLDGMVFEIESQDVRFINNEFSIKGEVDRNLELQEL